MTPASYNVRIWAIDVYRGKRATTYRVRWTVERKPYKRPFQSRALADSFRADLLTAVNKDEPFDPETGLPQSRRPAAADLTWYDFALSYIDQKWLRISAHNRKNTAKAFTKVTIALLRNEPTQFDPVRLRRALREYAFNKRYRDKAPADVKEVLGWVKRNSRSMTAWTQDEHLDAVLGSFATLLNGKAAAPSSYRREHRILNVALEYAVRTRVLRTNPLPALQGAQERAPWTTSAIDKRSLLNPAQVGGLLAWIGSRPRTGMTLRAFFATLYFAGLRPEEAVALRVADATLPEKGFGELIVYTSEPEVGSQWTDDGDVHETRGLKGRALGDTRLVPVRPELVAILREIIAIKQLGPGDLLFAGQNGGLLAGSVFRRAWDKARMAVLPEHEYHSPVGKRVYDLRHTCLTSWLNAGIPAPQVAEWAGNSVQILHATYARCIVGQKAALHQRIETGQKIPGLPVPLQGHGR